jgi:hypothetical protein
LPPDATFSVIFHNHQDPAELSEFLRRKGDIFQILSSGKSDTLG